MKVSRTSSTRPLGGTGAVAGVGAARPAAPAAPAAATEVRAPADVTSVMGVPEPELTPKVRAALGQLMNEVHRLREELEQAKKRIGFLEELSDQDPLVPVVNRRAFVRELSRFMAYSERYGVPGSVLYFDVNGMKQINDSYGHSVGDAVLKHVAEVLLRNLRSSDVVGRLGGDEFGVILMQANAEAGEAKGHELASSIVDTPLEHKGDLLQVGISVGVHAFSSGEHVDDALHAADQKMYAHKLASATTR
ncbi:diguanylate cyclase (GGDEF) domain-containing protein [Tistlia consotensis]|uniref:diguanylate cyclase n=1 Tax=Tistlia consotensis USBA 355 TaxID=560819 RepID=A0A1Y6C3U6_9PROT|nr:diguanylate cyclase (GGDEF) domain-containing protein [Tistlia consotensis USBA 355]SNR68444.1 diguanylate cyclase (GGDEF) domain-containing protein [Tistlia consotensis]